jgi:hypothetical protein
VLPCVISPQVLREVESLAVETKINKGKTETVSMTISGSVFSEYPGDKVRTVEFPEVARDVKLPPPSLLLTTGVPEVHYLPGSDRDESGVCRDQIHCP